MSAFGSQRSGLRACSGTDVRGTSSGLQARTGSSVQLGLVLCSGIQARTIGLVFGWEMSIAGFMVSYRRMLIWYSGRN